MKIKGSLHFQVFFSLFLQNCFRAWVQFNTVREYRTRKKRKQEQLCVFLCSLQLFSFLVFVSFFVGLLAI